MEMKLAGRTYDDIAQVLGYRSASGAYKAVMAAMKKTLQEPADELRKIEMARLDKMIGSIWAQVIAGNHGAIDRAIRIMDRRAKLLGLDMPTKHQVETWQHIAKDIGIDEQAASAMFEDMVRKLVEEATSE